VDPRRRLQAGPADQRARTGTPVWRLDVGDPGLPQRFNQFGLIDKRPNGGWVFKGFTRDFAEELCEVRLIFSGRGHETSDWLEPLAR
jgi:hypothetical protein